MKLQILTLFLITQVYSIPKVAALLGLSKKQRNISFAEWVKKETKAGDRDFKNLKVLDQPECFIY